MTTLEPDAFEEIFLKLEEECERRALEAEGIALSPDTPDLAVAAQRTIRRRQRHRGSVSVSRFGHIEEPTPQTGVSPSQMPPSFGHGMTTFAPFYESHNDSVDTWSDVSFFGDDEARSAESEHVTQVHRIAGRQSLPRSVGGILQRTLACSRSKHGLSSGGIDTNVVIGVVVEEDHVEEPESRESLPRQAGRTVAYVHAPSTLTSQSSGITIAGAGTRDVNWSWRSKAGELFKRKIRPRGSLLWTVTPAQQS